MPTEKPDGCTASPELWFHDCCIEHDIAYASHKAADGRIITRAQADAEFLRCAKAARKNRPITGNLIPLIYYTAIRIFGASRWKIDRG